MKIKKSILITLFVAIVVSLIGIASIDADVLSSGDTYTYYANRHKNGTFVPYSSSESGPLIFHVSGLTGTSIEPNVNVNSGASGEAIMTKLSSESLIAKVSYYWGVNKGYGLNYEHDNYEFLVRANQYAANAEAATAAMNSDNMSEDDIERVKSMVEEAGDITVPDGFVAYKGAPTDNSQKFVVWETGRDFYATKEYNCDTPNGFNRSLVKDGDTIIYDISWNSGSEQEQTITISDTISKGLSYVSGSSNMGEPAVKSNSDGTTTLTWTTTEKTGTLTYSAKVNASDQCSTGINKVSNNATITVGNLRYQLVGLENPLPSKCYAPKPNDGYNGQTVKVGNDIKYQITLANVKEKAVTASVVDIISRGLTYNKDAKVNAGELTAATASEADSNGNTKIQFTITVPAKSTVVLSYSAKVNNVASVRVLNNANVKYDSDRSVSLNQLENPVSSSSNPSNPDDPNNSDDSDDSGNSSYSDNSNGKGGTVISAPDTGSNVLILGVASGIALVGVGGYFIYKKMYKK